MSRYFVHEPDEENAMSLYEKKVFYRYWMMEKGYVNLVDFNEGEKCFYGRTDRLFIPIVFANSGNVKLKRLNKTLATGQKNNKTVAANFVVDAFNDMAQQFRKAVQIGTISSNDPFLSNLQIFKAYQDPKSLYSAYFKTQATAIAAQFAREKIKVRHFGEFITELMILLKRSAPRISFTKPGYIKSRYCPIACSALAIEVADINVTSEDDKVNNFISSPNWEFYVAACNNYGFMIDQNIPWRIVADIDSTGMKEYLSKYTFTGTTNEILEFNYNYAHLDYYINRFKHDLLKLYNKVKKKQFRESVNCGYTTTSRVVYPHSYTFDELTHLYSEQYFLNLYFKIRTLEEETPPAPDVLNNMYDDCMEVLAAKGVPAALTKFERVLNKPFDNRGSMSYLKEYLLKNKQ
tara:strand:+ start:3183 stop:4397 length:1215 start_codon:yes stop_codon:yes gene_type:complete